MPDYPISLPISVRDKGATQQLSKISGAMDRLTKHTTKLSGAFQNAFQFYVRFRIFGLINRGISTIEGAIPGLIARSREWARTVDEVADATGLAAGQASAFAGVAQIMSGNVEGLTRALGALAQQTANHGDVLKRYGIQTKDANGALLDTWTILGNVRKALSDTGNGFITTAAARDLFSRGGQTLLDMLTMTDKAFRMVVRDVQASGAVMSEQGLRVADQWERTTNRLQVQITGVANLLMEAIGPNLMRFTDAITNFIRANLEQIVGFLAKVVSAVVNFAAGFLGLDLSMESFAENTDKANKSAGNLQGRLDRFAKSRQDQTKREDAHTDAIKANIAAIDRQLAALSRQDRAENARAEQKRLLADISDAKRDLNELRGKAIFAAGMSNREAELARQAQAADIMEAQKKIADARKRLAEQNRKVAMDERRYELEQRKASLQEQLNAQMKAMADRQAADREAMQQLVGGGGKLKGLERVISSAKGAWAEVGPDFKEAGRNFRTALSGIGDNLLNLWESLKVELPKWIDTLSGIGDNIGKVAGLLGGVADWFENNTPFGGKDGQQVIPGVSLSPGEWLGLGAGAAATKGLWAKPLADLLSGGLKGVGSGIGGLFKGGGMGALRTVLSGLSKLALPLTLLEAAIKAFEFHGAWQGNDRQKQLNLTNLDQFLRTASAPQLGIAIENLKALPGNLDDVGSLAYNLSSGFAGLDVLLGNAKEHNERIIELLEGELERRNPPALPVGVGAGVTGGFDFSRVGIGSVGKSALVSSDASLAAIKRTLTGASGTVAATLEGSGMALKTIAVRTTGILSALPGPEYRQAALTSQRASSNYLFSNGRSIAQHAAVMAQYIQRIAYPRPGSVWGTANMYLYLDKDLALTLMGVPIQQGNSSTRSRST